MTPSDEPTFPANVVAAQALSQRVSTGEGTLDILVDVSLEVKAGETLAITGASGSGKSTLLGLLAGLDQPSSGKVWLLGQALNDLDEDARAKLRAARVGFVFQSFQLLPALTALENILLPLELAGAADARERAPRRVAERRGAPGAGGPDRDVGLAPGPVAPGLPAGAPARLTKT